MYGKMRKGMAAGGMIQKELHDSAKQMQEQKRYPTGGDERVKSGQQYGGMSKMADGGMAGKKPAVMAIVAKLSKKGSGEEMEEGEMEEGGEDMSAMKEAKMAASEDIMSALKSGDKEMFMNSLSEFVRMCGEEYGD